MFFDVREFSIALIASRTVPCNLQTMIEVFQSLTWKRLTLLSPEHVYAWKTCAVVLKGNLRGIGKKNEKKRERKGKERGKVKKEKGKWKNEKEGKGENEKEGNGKNCER